MKHHVTSQDPGSKHNKAVAWANATKWFEQQGARQLCPEWVLLALIAISIAVGTASPERAFSVLKIIKTRLRNSMSQPMLDALMRINLLLNFDELLDILPDIARKLKWITKTDRRANFGDGSIPEKYRRPEPTAVAPIFQSIKPQSSAAATSIFTVRTKL